VNAPCEDKKNPSLPNKGKQRGNPREYLYMMSK